MNPLICTRTILTGHGGAIRQSCSLRSWYNINQTSGSLAFIYTGTGYSRNTELLTQSYVPQNFSVPYSQVRSFYSNPIWRGQESSSKVEETVKNIKEEKEEKELQGKGKEKSELEVASKKALVEKKPLWETIKAGVMHYVHGFHLLFIDMRVSAKLIWRILQGKELTRREHRLLIKTTGDMFRLIPFSVFIIVPFMEFLLPVAIKLFPSMLPSTFQTATEKEDKLKQALKVKLEVAKFLQKTLDEMAVKSCGYKSAKAKEFAEFFYKIRTSGAVATTQEIMQFSKLFEDEITLDSLSRPQLVALCRVLDVQTLGTTNFLRFLLRMRLRSLAADDKLIQKEGVDSLTRSELQQACKARGMRAYGMPENRLKQQLSQWLDLSLNKKVPPSLLLLSRALMVPETIPTPDKLKATISALPDAIVTRTQGAINEKEGKLDHRTSIEIIKMEEKKIEEERQEEQTEPVSSTSPERTKKYEYTTKDVRVLEQALDTVGKGKQLAVEKEEIKELKEEMAEYQEDVKELNEIKAAAKDRADIQSIKESTGAKLLYNRVNKMIKKMDGLLEQLEQSEKEVKQKMNALDSEQQAKVEEVQNEKVKIVELIETIKLIQNVPDESRIKRIREILGKMDDDRDGAIEIEDVLKVLELIGKEDGKLTKKQMVELIDLLEKEEILDEIVQKQKVKDAEEKHAQELSKASQCETAATSKTSVPKSQTTEKGQQNETKGSMHSSTSSPPVESDIETKSEPLFKDSDPESTVTGTPLPPAVGPKSKKAEGSKQL